MNTTKCVKSAITLEVPTDSFTALKQLIPRVLELWGATGNNQVLRMVDTGSCVHCLHVATCSTLHYVWHKVPFSRAACGQVRRWGCSENDFMQNI